ncbi:MAG: MBL fold metallo-hydrolase [Vicinamibacterales bacterium]
MRAAALVVLLALAQSAPLPDPPAAREIAPQTFLVPGAMLPDRGPDGNSVIITAPDGLVVVDTGRHPWHSDGIVAFARAHHAAITAIVNTHWHLDHASGNVRLKAAFPTARVYTTRAVERAIAPGGFLARNLDAARARPPEADAPAVRQEERALFLATMDAAAALTPDVAVEQSGPLMLAGRRFAAHVTDGAVTDADLWLYDEATRVAIIGDLVTVPAPFFETACPAQWEAALDEVWATPFEQAVPGHGPVLTRAAFDTYRTAFRRFRACVAGDTAAAGCAEAWTRDAGRFFDTDADRRQATEYASYYVDFLRKGGGASADCRAR